MHPQQGVGKCPEAEGARGDPYGRQKERAGRLASAQAAAVGEQWPWPGDWLGHCHHDQGLAQPFGWQPHDTQEDG